MACSLAFTCLPWASTGSGLMFPSVYLQNSVCKQCSCNLPGASLCAILWIGKLLAHKMRWTYWKKKANKLATFFFSCWIFAIIICSRLRKFSFTPYIFSVNEQLRVHPWTIRNCIFSSVYLFLTFPWPLLWRLSSFMWILRTCSKVFFKLT